jgi:FKBP-type peptidyl-prolyl cis-trans isomerase 2
MARSLVRDEEGLSTLWSLIGVLVLVIAILGVYYGYVVPRFPGPPIRAQNGDEVRVDYVGTFVENGYVFDTSLLSVARDNASYTKAFSFAWHGEWAPLRFTVGAGTVVKGFDLGVEGLAVGDSKTIVVPPALGYGASDPSKIFVKSLYESVPVRLTMNATDFRTTYSTPAVSGTTVADPFWGWPAGVSVAGTVVTVTNSPVPGLKYRPYGAWDAQVVSIDDGADGGVGRIVVHHLLDSSSVDRIGKKDASGKVVFVVTAVDVAAGTYTLNFNDAVKGRTLIFRVTMVSIGRLF